MYLIPTQSVHETLLINDRFFVTLYKLNLTGTMWMGEVQYVRSKVDIAILFIRR